MHILLAAGGAGPRDIGLFEYQTLFDQRGDLYSRANRLYPDARAEEAAALLSHLALPAGARWLDVSAGGGYLSERARAQGFPPARFSCDGSLAFLRSGGEYAAGCVAAAEALPFPDGRFAAAASLAALHHSEDPRAACRELLRVTSRGGRAALGDAAADSETARFLNSFVDRHTTSGHHGRFHSPEALAGFFEAAGGRGARAERVRLFWRLPSRADAVVFFRSLFGLVPETTDGEIDESFEQLRAVPDSGAFSIPWTMNYVSASPA
jgi:SAM-dependent methyltransferase